MAGKVRNVELMEREHLGGGVYMSVEARETEADDGKLVRESPRVLLTSDFSRPIYLSLSALSVILLKLDDINLGLEL